MHSPAPSGRRDPPLRLGADDEATPALPPLRPEYFQLWFGRTRICIARIPQDEAPETWAGQLLLRLQQRKEQRFLQRQDERGQ